MEEYTNSIIPSRDLTRIIEVKGAQNLLSDTEGSLVFLNTKEGASKLNLGGNKFKVLGEGITVSTNKGSYIGNGIITSDAKFLTIRFTVPSEIGSGLDIGSAIANGDRGAIGLRISGINRHMAHVLLTGAQANSFTGETLVSGGGTALTLAKKNGVISLAGNATIRDGAYLRFDSSDQMAKGITVTLKKGNLRFPSISRELSNQFRNLRVEGKCRLEFGHNTDRIDTRFLYLDNLIIEKDSLLSVVGWIDGVDHLLVRRDSAHLAAALKKIQFAGYDPKTVNTRDFNKDYWELYAELPEPAICGAILGGLGVALVLWRRRQSRRSRPARASLGGESDG